MQNFFELHIKPYLLYLDTHTSARYLLVSIILLALGILLREKKRTSKESAHSVQAIAGDDVISTQLDLAKAYIEMGNQDLALPILKEVKRKGNAAQQVQAHRLLNSI